MARQPTIYLPHGGGPCFFMDWTFGPADTWARLRAWLEALPGTLPEPPRALLVISAHWEARIPTVTTAVRPSLIFDYHGFPEHTYALTWPAPGSPALSVRVRALLAAAGIDSAQDGGRGFDHGVFVPLKVAWPEANVPTVALSLQAGLDPEAHLAIGRALAPLRDEGVLVVGSGMSFHNMRMFGRPEALSISATFDAWLDRAVRAARPEREEHLSAWASAPAGRASHPREEHLLPLMVVAGAAGDDAGEVVFRDDVMAARVSAVRFG